MSKKKIQEKIKETKYNRISYKTRLKIEALYNAKMKPSRIAAQLGFVPSSIYRELEKGYYMHKNGDWTYTKRYSADRAEQKTDFNVSTRSPDLKIGKNYDFIEKMEYLILEKKYSPRAALQKLKASDPNTPDISYNTVYRYIDSGLFV